MSRTGSSRLACVLAASLTLVVVAGPVAADDAGAARGAAAAAAAARHVTPPALDDVEHMCALLTGCEHLPLPSGLVPPDFAGCVRSVYASLASGSAVTYSLTLRECGLRASSCAELRTCALRGARVDICTGRGKSGPVDMCDGAGRAITCVNERVAAVRDCPRGGEQCVVLGGHATCALGACETDAPPACSRSGTRILECRKGKLVSLDCGAFGLRCDSSPTGPRCATEGAACTEGATRCDGAMSIVCWHGHEVRIDCAASGLACGGTGEAVGGCTAPDPARAGGGASCDPASPPRCDGATLKWCAWGTPRSYLCKSLGLPRCVSDDKGAARCAG
jgi:hypothetical protein